jgi:hypothetical protein
LFSFSFKTKRTESPLHTVKKKYTPGPNARANGAVLNKASPQFLVPWTAEVLRIPQVIERINLAPEAIYTVLSFPHYPAAVLATWVYSTPLLALIPYFLVHRT